MDADGQHLPEEVPKLVEMLGGGFDMAVATRTRKRHLADQKFPGNKLLNTIASWICGYRIPDLTSGSGRSPRPLTTVCPYVSQPI